MPKEKKAKRSTRRGEATAVAALAPPFAAGIAPPPPLASFSGLPLQSPVPINAAPKPYAREARNSTVAARARLLARQAEPEVSGAPRRAAGHLYAQQDRAKGYKRKGMSDAVTDRMENEIGTRGPASSYEQTMAFDRSLPEDQQRGLKDLGVSRNHIVADSNVAKIVLTAVAAHDAQAPAHHRAAVRHFVGTLGGTDNGPAALASLDQAYAHKEAGNHAHADAHARAAVNLASVGNGNIRFGDAGRNGVALHGFDMETDDSGFPTPRALDAHAALRGLWPVPHLTEHALRAGQQTIDNRGSTPAYISSNVGDRLAMDDPDTFASNKRRRTGSSEAP